MKKNFELQSPFDLNCPCVYHFSPMNFDLLWFFHCCHDIPNNILAEPHHLLVALSLRIPFPCFFFSLPSPCLLYLSPLLFPSAPLSSFSFFFSPAPVLAPFLLSCHASFFLSSHPNLFPSLFLYFPVDGHGAHLLAIPIGPPAYSVF